MKVKELYDYAVKGGVQKMNSKLRKRLGRLYILHLLMIYWFQAARRKKSSSSGSLIRGKTTKELWQDTSQKTGGTSWSVVIGGTRMQYNTNCLECAIVLEVGRVNWPLLHAIPVHHPFQIWRVDIMELPAKGNKYAWRYILRPVHQNQWPLVFADMWSLTRKP